MRSARRVRPILLSWCSTKLLSLYGCRSNSVYFAALQLEHQETSGFRSYGFSDTTIRVFQRDVSLQACVRNTEFRQSNTSATKCCKPVARNAATQSRVADQQREVAKSCNHLQHSATFATSTLVQPQPTATVASVAGCKRVAGCKTRRPTRSKSARTPAFAHPRRCGATRPPQSTMALRVGIAR